jgi:tRNA threonylcarbamoyladenosine biosynthesis protein TsaE
VPTELPDEAATRVYAAELARRLPTGALLLLDGPLGAGKTTLVAALVAALGGPARTSSPTYTLVHEYPTPQGPVVHVDAFRLGDPGQLAALGLDDYLDRARLVVVEWGGPLAEAYPEAWRLRLERPAGAATRRRAELLPPGR